MILGVGETLSLADVSWLFNELQPLPEVVDSGNQESDFAIQSDGVLAGMPLAQVERQAILETLKQAKGNQTKAAKVLGISDRTLRDKVRRYRQQVSLQPV